MSMASEISECLSANLQLEHMEVVDETGGHNVPPGSESHFKLVLVSPDFEDQSRIARHRQLNKLLAAQLERIHALAMHLYTPAEWQAKFGEAPMSPPCLGGSSVDKEN